MLELSNKNLEIIDSLIDFKVFDDIEGYRLDRKNGIILVCCADGDQFHDLYYHECSFQSGQRKDKNPRIHPLSHNGGVLAYAENNLINRFPTSYLEYLYEIGGSLELKKMPTIVIEGHGPCGAAHKHAIDFIPQLETQMTVKEVVKQMHPHVDVASHFHVDYNGRNGKEKKTYHFGRERWAEWLRTKAAPFLAFA
jgi:hypothetical protein